MSNNTTTRAANGVTYYQDWEQEGHIVLSLTQRPQYYTISSSMKTSPLLAITSGRSAKSNSIGLSKTNILRMLISCASVAVEGYSVQARQLPTLRPTMPTNASV